jgi:hypothetical protein
MPQESEIIQRRPRKSKIARKSVRDMSEKEFDDLVETFCLVLKSYGEFSLGIGTIEKKYPDALKTFDIVYTPEMMNQMIRAMPSEVVGKLVKVLLQFSAIAPQIQNFGTLPPDKKIQLGRIMIQLSGDLRDLAKAGE